MKLIRSSLSKGFEIILGDGSSRFLPSYGSVAVDDALAAGGTVEEHRARGSIVVSDVKVDLPPVSTKKKPVAGEGKE